jgi:hypothetical protein
MRKLPGGLLQPADEVAHAALQRIRNNSVVAAEVTQSRNPKLHRKYFKMLDVAYSNQERYHDKEEFRREVLIEAGFYTLHHHRNGQVSKVPRSICFAEMDDIEFRRVYDQSLEAILRAFLPGTDQKLFEQAVNEMMRF